MADPTTAALLAKAALAVATDKKTWKIILAIIVGFAIVIVTPFLAILSIIDGGAKHNQDAVKIVFEGGAIPQNYPQEYKNYMTKMQTEFAKLDEQIAEVEKQLTAENLDNTRIKVVFYTLFFGKTMDGMDDEFYKNFVQAFTEADVSNPPKLKIVADTTKIYANIATLIGREVTADEISNINNMYNFLKFGVASNDGTEGISAEALNDATFATLMAEATKYIGYPYVWGGSTPATSFDCSGFVCWSFTKSGVYNLPRTTAQGIYNQTTKVSESEVKPGDLVFFTGTYDSPNAVTHIGIYVGDGKMLHCGSSIGYAKLDNKYWRSHFYAYGRLNS